MATHATITFSQPGVQPPVYVTSSLSGWTPLEMDIAHDKTSTGDLVFTKNFTNVDPGSYQYKVRLGQDNWILDESKETATDDQGIRNNVIHVEPASSETTQSPTPDAPASQPATAPTAPPSEPASKRFDNRKDSTMDQDSFPTASADAGHHTAKAMFDSPAEPNGLKPSSVPLLVVDKVESSPAHEQDASDAPAAHKIAHEAGAADALPDKVNIVPQHHVEPGTNDEQAAPLFRHESVQHNQPPSAPSMGTIDEESTPSSADHTSSGEGMDTPSEVEEGDEGDELNLMPLLSHETALTPGNNEPANGPLFGHEARPDHHDTDEAPLFPHESPLPEDTAVATDSDGGDELDRIPLLAHEGRSSGFNPSMAAATNGHSGEVEPQHYKPFDEELDNHPEADDGDAPLLPHERESQIPHNISSHAFKDYAASPVDKQPDFGHETDGARSFFDRPGRYDIFKSQKNSSLPHRMPRSDAEDEDLNDPSLERFPTNRDQIFQRVASIGAELPEDEATHGHHPNSPQPSVFSQACSSVDLVPVKSYTSLASVPEAENSDEEEDNHDLDSLPSPIYLGRKRSLRMSNRPTGFSRDPHATPVISASRQLGDIMQDTHESSDDEERESGTKAESINKHDGAADSSNPLGILREPISMPGENATDSAPSDPKPTPGAAPADSELRQRRGPAEEASQAPDAPDTAAKEATAPDKDVTNAAPSSALGHQQADKHDATSLKHLFGAAFGDRKRASASALVLGGVLAAYYFRTAKP